MGGNYARISNTFEFFQSLLTVADGDHPFIVLAALVGLKPFIDTWRAITGAEQGKEDLPVLSMVC